MKIANDERIAEFIKKHTDARKPLERWISDMEGSTFLNPAAIRERWADASFISGTHIVFNIKGNRYRLYVEVVYFEKTVYILRIGTHKEYDTWNLR